MKKITGLLMAVCFDAECVRECAFDRRKVLLVSDQEVLSSSNAI